MKADAHVSETVRPDAVEPVNETIPTSSWATSGAPSVARRSRCTTFTTPLGSPASSRSLTRLSGRERAYRGRA